MDWMTTEQIAVASGKPRATVVRWCRLKMLPAEKVPMADGNVMGYRVKAEDWKRLEDALVALRRGRPRKGE